MPSPAVPSLARRALLAALLTAAVPADSLRFAPSCAGVARSASRAHVKLGQGVVVEDGFIINKNPATGEVIGRVPVSTRENVDAAVAAAQEAQRQWSALPLAERTELVSAAVRRIGDELTLAELITREMGKTLQESKDEVADNSDMDAYCEAVMRANEPETHGSSIIVRHPHGVVSVCAPWNYPIEEIVLLSIPALVAGNAVVIKPSEVVPLSGEKVVGALMAGLNDRFPGLVNLVQGDGVWRGFKLVPLMVREP